MKPRRPRREQVLDYPHEGLERRRIGIDQADAEQIEMKGARNVPRRIGVRRTEIEDRWLFRAGVRQVRDSSSAEINRPGFS